MLHFFSFPRELLCDLSSVTTTGNSIQSSPRSPRKAETNLRNLRAVGLSPGLSCKIQNPSRRTHAILAVYMPFADTHRVETMSGEQHMAPMAGAPSAVKEADESIQVQFDSLLYVQSRLVSFSLTHHTSFGIVQEIGGPAPTGHGTRVIHYVYHLSSHKLQCTSRGWNDLFRSHSCRQRRSLACENLSAASLHWFASRATSLSKSDSGRSTPTHSCIMC